MKHVVLLLLLICSMVTLAPANSNLAEVNERWEKAHLAFERGEFRSAMNEYVAIATGGTASPRVWTNAGTAAYRNGERGLSVLYYLRALKMDPNYTPARESLSVISPSTNDNENSASTLLLGISGFVSTTSFVLGAQVCFLLVCLSIARMLGSASGEQRSHWVAVFGWCLGLTIIFSGIGYWSYRIHQEPNAAVVVNEGAITRSEPTAESVAQLELPAGTIVETVGDARRGFLRVTLRDGRSGFLSVEDIEKI